MTGHRIAVALAISLASGSAYADRAGALSARADASYAVAEAGDVAVAGVVLRALIDGRWTGELDLHAGLGRDGFAYRAVALPLGVGLRLPGRVDLGLAAGGGIDGVVGTVPIAVPIAVAGFAELELGRRWRIGTYTRLSWFALAEPRDASILGSTADELFGEISIRGGTRNDEYNGHAARGWRAALAWQRRHDGDAIVISIGYAVDVGWAATPAPFPRG